MTQEQKAKAYDNVRDKIAIRFGSNVANEIFSEYEESEDEKIISAIRKALESKVEDLGNGVTRTACLAWLEKQGERDMKEAFHTEYEKGRADAITEMQKEQMQEYLEGVDRVQNYEELTKFEKGFDRIADTYAHRKNKDGYNKPWYTKERAAEMLHWAKEALGIFNEQKPYDNATIVVHHDFAPKSATEALKEEKVDNQNCVKPANKIEPKFKVGDWVVTSYGKVNQVVSVDKDGDGYTLDDDVYFSGSWCNMYHLWTIQDAKDGDLIYVSTKDKGIHAIFHEYKNNTIFFHCYLCGDFVQGGYMPIDIVELVHPLPKTHYNRFFERINEAGYTFDFEKKELKKFEHNSAWGEEDEKMIDNIIDYMMPMPIFFTSTKGKSGKEYTKEFIKEAVDWLKSLRPQSTWKPSDEQMEILQYLCEASSHSNEKVIPTLKSIYQDLKKLKGELL